MKNIKLYKYINLLLRIIIGVVAVWFIYVKLKDGFLIEFQKISAGKINYRLIVVAVLMLLINWGIEALKWRYAIRKTEEISFFKAFKLTITGITIGLLTPNRIGEIPARALLLSKDYFKEITLKTAVASFSQVLITYLVGMVGLILSYDYFNIPISPIIMIVILVIGSVALFLVYFKVNKLEFIFDKIKFLKEKKIFNALSEFSFYELFTLLGLSFLRYIVFSIQFWLVLRAFGIILVSLDDILLIAVCFMVASFIPTILISEIGVRGSVALFVFGTVSDMDFQIILASVLLWLINVGLPALIGIVNLKELKILKEN